MGATGSFTTSTADLADVDLGTTEVSSAEAGSTGAFGSCRRVRFGFSVASFVLFDESLVESDTDLELLVTGCFFGVSSAFWKGLGIEVIKIVSEEQPRCWAQNDSAASRCQVGKIYPPLNCHFLPIFGNLILPKSILRHLQFVFIWPQFCIIGLVESPGGAYEKFS